MQIETFSEIKFLTELGANLGISCFSLKFTEFDTTYGITAEGKDGLYFWKDCRKPNYQNRYRRDIDSITIPFFCSYSSNKQHFTISYDSKDYLDFTIDIYNFAKVVNHKDGNAAIYPPPINTEERNDKALIINLCKSIAKSGYNLDADTFSKNLIDFIKIIMKSDPHFMTKQIGH